MGASETVHIRSYFNKERKAWIRRNRWVYVFWLVLLVSSILGFVGDVVMGSMFYWLPENMGSSEIQNYVYLSTTIMMPFVLLSYLGRIALLPLATVLAVQWIRSLRISEEYLVAIGGENFLSQARSFLRRYLFILLALCGLLPFILMYVTEIVLRMIFHSPELYGGTSLLMQIGLVWLVVELSLLLTIRFWKRGAGLSVVVALITCMVVNLIGFMLISPWNPNFNIITGWILTSLAAVIWIYNRRPISGLTEQLINDR